MCFRCLPRQVLARAVQHLRQPGLLHDGKGRQPLTEGRSPQVSLCMGLCALMTIQRLHGPSHSMKVWKQKLPICQVLPCTLMAATLQFVLSKPIAQSGECCWSRRQEEVVLVCLLQSSPRLTKSKATRICTAEQLRLYWLIVGWPAPPMSTTEQGNLTAPAANALLMETGFPVWGLALHFFLRKSAVFEDICFTTTLCKKILQWSWLLLSQFWCRASLCYAPGATSYWDQNLPPSRSLSLYRSSYPMLARMCRDWQLHAKGTLSTDSCGAWLLLLGQSDSLAAACHSTALFCGFALWHVACWHYFRCSVGP